MKTANAVRRKVNSLSAQGAASAGACPYLSFPSRARNKPIYALARLLTHIFLGEGECIHSKACIHAQMVQYFSQKPYISWLVGRPFLPLESRHAKTHKKLRKYLLINLMRMPLTIWSQAKSRHFCARALVVHHSALRNRHSTFSCALTHRTLCLFGFFEI